MPSTIQIIIYIYAIELIFMSLFYIHIGQDSGKDEKRKDKGKKNKIIMYKKVWDTIFLIEDFGKG